MDLLPKDLHFDESQSHRTDQGDSEDFEECMVDCMAFGPSQYHRTDQAIPSEMGQLVKADHRERRNPTVLTRAIPRKVLSSQNEMGELRRNPTVLTRAIPRSFFNCPSRLSTKKSQSHRTDQGNSEVDLKPGDVFCLPVA